VAKKDAGKRSLADAVKAHLAQHKARAMPWWDRVAPEHMPELEEFKRGWLAGEYGTAMRPVAAQVAAWMNEAGISPVGAQGVITWLKRP
jgi:hypothetical protein